jgi:glutaredoxin-like protein NrdH
MPQITVYSQPNCMPCRATVRKLNALGAPYTKVDVTEDEDALALIQELGYKQTPVVVVDDVHWGGYSPDKLAWAAQHVADA